MFYLKVQYHGLKWAKDKTQNHYKVLTELVMGDFWAQVERAIVGTTKLTRWTEVQFGVLTRNDLLTRLGVDDTGLQEQGHSLHYDYRKGGGGIISFHLGLFVFHTIHVGLYKHTHTR